MRILPLGESALLIELPDSSTRRRLDDLLRRQPIEGVIEHVPAAQTIAVMVRDTSSTTEIRAALVALEQLLSSNHEESAVHRAAPIKLSVTYDGADLIEVAEALQCSVDEVVAWHTGQLWTVEFCGFMPGFGYLIGEDESLAIPRKSTPRTNVPASSLALAGRWTGVYPRSSPGGWQLIGTVLDPVWNPATGAILTPGTTIQFVDAT